MIARDAVFGSAIALETSAITLAAFTVTEGVPTYVIHPDSTLLHTSSRIWFEVYKIRIARKADLIIANIALIKTVYAARVTGNAQFTCGVLGTITGPS